MTTTIDINIAADICSDIIEDGKKLRSLDQLMEKYQLGFPFQASHQRFGIVEIVGSVGLREDIVPCILCKRKGTNVSGMSCYQSTVCCACYYNDASMAGWDPNTESWILA